MGSGAWLNHLTLVPSYSMSERHYKKAKQSSGGYRALISLFADICVIIVSVTSNDIPNAIARFVGDSLAYGIANAIFVVAILSLAILGGLYMASIVAKQFGVTKEGASKTLNKNWKPILIVGIISVATFAGVATYRAFSSQHIVSYYSIANVSGVVTTIGLGTAPVNVQFQGTTGIAYQVSVLPNGAYTLPLPTNDNYSVTVKWTFLGVNGGVCYYGSVYVPSDTANMRVDVKC